jgi:hypothetical protein
VKTIKSQNRFEGIEDLDWWSILYVYA